MDIARALPHGIDAVAVISSNNSPNMLGIYYEPMSASGLKARWLIRQAEGQPVTSLEDVSLLHEAALDMNLTEDSEGRLEVTFGVPIAAGYKLFLVATGDPEGPHAVVFRKDGQLARFAEVFLQASEGQAFCRCFWLSGAASGEEFVETMQVDLGPLAAFM